jgi:hypothetical protein
MVAVVGASTLLARGISAAAFHTVPLAIVYLSWSMIYGTIDAQAAASFPLGLMLEWIWEGLKQSLLGFAGMPLIAAALAGVMLYGLARIAPSLADSRRRRQLSSAIGLSFAPLLLFAAASTQRWSLGIDGIADQSRYLGLTAAFVLPLLAVAMDEVARRHSRIWPLLVFLLVAGIPSHLPKLWLEGRSASFFEQERAFVLAVAASPLAEQVRPGVHPDPYQIGADELTVGWLLAAREDGKLPAPYPRASERSQREIEDFVAMRLSLSQEIAPLPDELLCETRTAPRDYQTRIGDRFGLREAVSIALLRDGRMLYPPLLYDPRRSGALLRVEVPNVVVRVLGGRSTDGYTFCHAPRTRS